jgi:hypothetical protein
LEVIPDKNEVTVQRKEEILQLVKAHPNWSLATLQRRGAAELKHLRYVGVWQRQVNSGGTIFEKYAAIDGFVWEQFVEARNELQSISQSTLRGWAMQKAQSFSDPTFKFTASQGWIHDFKSRHSISSRKITKITSKSELKSQEMIMRSAEKFRIEFEEKSKLFSPQFILNTDQTGFCYEIVSKRTLSHIGEKITATCAKSPKNLMTHSYTVQYIINLSGDIVGDLFLCLQETSGRLGPVVIEKLFQAPNVSVTCSKSGKLTSSHVEYFLDNVLKPAATQDFLYLIDCWTGQINADLYTDRFDPVQCVVQFIPRKTTSFCQPLDTTFHQQLKYFAKRMTAYSTILDLHPEDEITTRNNVIRMQSLIHFQFSATIFKPMIKYAWVTAGLAQKTENFLTVQQACFSFNESDLQVCQILQSNSVCDKPRFIKCAHCRKILCYDCFFFDYHGVVEKCV